MVIGVDGNEANNVRSDINARVGVNQYAFGLLHALYKIDKKNEYCIYLEFPPRRDLPPERENWKYKVTGSAKFWTQWRLPLELFLGTPRPDVFFTPSHYAPRFSPVPTVVSIMDLGFYKFPEQFKKKDLWQLKSWTGYSVKKATHILAISESTKKDIISRYRISPEKITVTYPGYDKERYQISIRQLADKYQKYISKIKNKYGIANDYVLFLSTLKPSKNIEGLLEAFSLITNHYSLVALVIAGSKGWLHETIFKKAEELGIKDSVIFTGFVPDDEVPALMAGAKVFVLPSFWEGFGIPVVEAMAVGTPVVVSNIASLPEIVGDAGVIVDPYAPQDIARGLESVISLPQTEYNNLKRKLVLQARKFDWEKTAMQTLKVLQEAGNV